MAKFCSKCGHENRDGATFCGKCGASFPAPGATPGAMPPPAAPAPEVLDKAKDMAARAGSALKPAAEKAGEVMTPLAQKAAAKTWQESKRGAGWLKDVIRGGGESALREIFRPVPLIAQGQVVAQPTTTGATAPLEPAAFWFGAAAVLGWLVFRFPLLEKTIALSIASLVLLLLSWRGARRPYFSRLTFSSIWKFFRSGGKENRTSSTTFGVRDMSTGAVWQVTMLGSPRGNLPHQGQSVAIWGIAAEKSAELRAWKVSVLDAASQPTSATCTAPRLIPLSVALLFLTALMWVVWLVTLIGGIIL